jgi:hypothetical protein
LTNGSSSFYFRSARSSPQTEVTTIGSLRTSTYTHFLLLKDVYLEVRYPLGIDKIINANNFLGCQMTCNMWMISAIAAILQTAQTSRSFTKLKIQSKSHIILASPAQAVHALQNNMENPKFSTCRNLSLGNSPQKLKT